MQRRSRPATTPCPVQRLRPRSIAAWDAFVTAVVKRYKGRITSYQIWNEASLAMFWNGTPGEDGGTDQARLRHHQGGGPEGDRRGGEHDRAAGGRVRPLLPRYLAALGELGWPIDVFAAHMYPASKGTTDERAAFITQVTDALATAGAPDLPVWDTELNYGLAGPGPTNPLQTIAGAKARDWVVQTTFDSLAPRHLPHLLVHLDPGAVRAARHAADQRLGRGQGPAHSRSVDRGRHDARAARTRSACTLCPVEKNGIPSVIAWADDTPRPSRRPPVSRRCARQPTSARRSTDRSPSPRRPYA